MIMMNLVIESLLYSIPLLLATFLLSSRIFVRHHFAKSVLDEYLDNPRYLALLYEWGWLKILFLLPIFAFIEEIVFRGILQGVIGIFASSFVFALVHPVSISGRCFIFICSVYIGWVFKLSGENLFVVTIMHCIQNIFALWRIKDYAANRAISRPGSGVSSPL